MLRICALNESSSEDEVQRREERNAVKKRLMMHEHLGGCRKRAGGDEGSTGGSPFGPLQLCSSGIDIWHPFISLWPVLVLLTQIWSPFWSLLGSGPEIKFTLFVFRMLFLRVTNFAGSGERKWQKSNRAAFRDNKVPTIQVFTNY